MLTLYFQENPQDKNFSAFQSQIDPFPDKFTEYANESEYYDIFSDMSLKSGKLGSTFVPRRVYFIKPTNLAEHI